MSPSHLETIPLDVLQHIAYMTVASTPFESMSAVSRLLLCSRTIYHTLSLESCPELYARVFRIKFDLAASLRRSHSSLLITSRLAAELKRRCMVLHRIRQCRISHEGILSDLWTIYLMILESDGMNEIQLQTAGISRFVVNLLQHRLHQEVATGGWPLENPTNALTVWITCLSLSKEYITNQRVQERSELLTLLRPFTILSSQYSSISLYDPSQPTTTINPDQATLAQPPTYDWNGFPEYSQAFTLFCPSLVSAAIFLTFALKEVSEYQVPPHLPRDRAAAIAAQRAGPTMADYSRMTGIRTPLIADSYHSATSGPLPSSDANSQPSRSTQHDGDFYRIARRPLPLNDLPIHRAYVPGSLTGHWAGSYLLSPLSLVTHQSNFSTLPDFVNRQPLQCELQEHLCFTPCIPIPRNGDPFLDVPVQWDADIDNRVNSQESSTSHTRIDESYQYEPYSPNGTLCSRRDPLDIIITGETTPEYNQAWNAFKFVGRVRLTDGLVVLRREPKNPDEGLGTWIFEGHVLYNRVLVGRWRSSRPINIPGLEGIFSLSKKKE